MLYFRWVTYTSFHPNNARRIFPCFDEPKFKAHFDLVIKRDKKFLSSVSNAKLKTTEGAEEYNTVHDFYEQTPKMSPHLLAFVISDFAVGWNYFRNFSLISTHAAGMTTNYTFHRVERILDEYNKHMPIGYGDIGISKMHFVAIPDYPYGAKASWGLIIFK